MHGDDMGLRLPPLMAPLQIVVVPILRKNADVAGIIAAAEGLVSAASKANVRARLDGDETKSPGFRFSYWEQKVRLFCLPEKAPSSLSSLKTCLMTCPESCLSNLI